MRSGSPLPRSFYRRDPRDVGPELLGKLLVRGPLSARIVEVEAYCGPIDPGSHTYRGQTKRNATMFGPPGHLYVYFTYGMHWCANAVCGDEGEGVAVLLRAAEPLTGLDAMRENRPKARSDRELCAGPARLCQAFGIAGANDGTDLVTSDQGITIVDDDTPPPDHSTSKRIGLTRGTDFEWRYCAKGSRYLSKPE